MENESSYLLEVKRKVRDLVRGLRPIANASPQHSAASQASAACALAGLFNRQPETRQLFLAEGGVLAALELLDAELARVAEAGLEVLRAFTASDTRLLESLCLVGLVPVVVRLAAAGGAVSGSSWQALGSGSSYTSASVGSGGSGPGKDAAGTVGQGAAAGAASLAATAAAGVGALGLGGPAVHSGTSAEVTHLRKKAAGFVVQLCFAKETTLQMFIACGGLRCLVVMVQDNLQDCNTLTPVAVACIWQVLETYGALPINYICRIFAAAGLIPRLYAVIKQLINISRQQQQARGGIGSFAAAQGATGLKLQHLNCPLTPQGLPFATADFFPLGTIGPGSRDVPQAAAAADGSSDAMGGSMAVQANAKTIGKTMVGVRKGSPVVESGLAGALGGIRTLKQRTCSNGGCTDLVSSITTSGNVAGNCSSSQLPAYLLLLDSLYGLGWCLLQALMSCSSSSIGEPCPTWTTGAAQQWQQQQAVTIPHSSSRASSSSNSRRGLSGCRRSAWTCCWC
jgi:hypothetical protein